MYSKLKLPLIIVCTILTVGCSNVSSSWSCKNSMNGTCGTIKEIEDGNITNKDNKNNKNKFFIKNNKNIMKEEEKELSNFDDYRSKESVARVIFSPYIDEAGNRHDYSTVYFLEQKSEWKK